MTTVTALPLIVERVSPGHYRVPGTGIEVVCLNRLWYVRHGGQLREVAGQREWTTLRDCLAALRRRSDALRAAGDAA